jgi:hypothetical protein
MMTAMIAALDRHAAVYPVEAGQAVRPKLP